MSPIYRACLGLPGVPCGTLVIGASRCPEHARIAARKPVRRPSAWDALARRTIRAHLRTTGPYCPGDPPDHDAHPSFDLTLDHVVPLDAGGPMLDPSNVRVLCRSWNSHLGNRSRTGGGGGTSP